MCFSVIQHLIPQVPVPGFELEERFAQLPFEMSCGDNFAIFFPDSDLTQVFRLQVGVPMHVLPFWLDPIAIPVCRLVVLDQEGADALVIIWRMVISESYCHVGTLFLHNRYLIIIDGWKIR